MTRQPYYKCVRSLLSTTMEKTMRRVMVRYKVKADRAAENESYVKKVFEQLERERPAGVRYATFKLDDGVSFVHIASIQSRTAGIR